MSDLTPEALAEYPQPFRGRYRPAQPRKDHTVKPATETTKTQTVPGEGVDADVLLDIATSALSKLTDADWDTRRVVIDGLVEVLRQKMAN